MLIQTWFLNKESLQILIFPLIKKRIIQVLLNFPYSLKYILYNCIANLKEASHVRQGTPWKHYAKVCLILFCNGLNIYTGVFPGCCYLIIWTKSRYLHSSKKLSVSMKYCENSLSTIEILIWYSYYFSLIKRHKLQGI